MFLGQFSLYLHNEVLCSFFNLCFPRIFNDIEKYLYSAITPVCKLPQMIWKTKRDYVTSAGSTRVEDGLQPLPRSVWVQSPLPRVTCNVFAFLFQYEYFNAVLINERDKDGNFLELGKEFILAPNDHFNNLPVNISLSDVQVPTNMYNKGKIHCCCSFHRVRKKGCGGRTGWFGILCFFVKIQL